MRVLHYSISSPAPSLNVLATYINKAFTGRRTSQWSQLTRLNSLDMEAFNNDKFSNRVNELLEEWHCPGIAIALVQDDKTSARAFGKACMEPEKPMTTNTLFDIASSSKSLTAAAVALLVEDERYPQVKWDAKMSDLLPDDFVMSEESYTKDVTVEDILSHRTGLPRYVDASFSTLDVADLTATATTSPINTPTPPAP